MGETNERVIPYSVVLEAVKVAADVGRGSAIAYLHHWIGQNLATPPPAPAPAQGEPVAWRKVYAREGGRELPGPWFGEDFPDAAAIERYKTNGTRVEYAYPPQPSPAVRLPEIQDVEVKDGKAVVFGIPAGGLPEEHPGYHNCDTMGCGSFDHVLARVPVAAPAQGEPIPVMFVQYDDFVTLATQDEPHGMMLVNASPVQIHSDDVPLYAAPPQPSPAVGQEPPEVLLIRDANGDLREADAEGVRSGSPIYRVAAAVGQAD